MENVKRIVNLLKKSNNFFFATLNEDQPNVRPFNAAIEFEGKVYLYTNNRNSAYTQLKNNPKVGICAMISEDRWLKLKGEVVFDNRVSVKKAMLEENPSLKKFYSENDKIFEVFYLTNVTAKIHSNYDSPEVIC
ncbi:MAG: pyridoxamine 5'-phosphate oxidase family protein [Clostridia bacterium]|nr:pyridoxamine 5'-phosphate oxidase family protein [Clostridia bacterium]